MFTYMNQAREPHETSRDPAVPNVGGARDCMCNAGHSHGMQPASPNYKTGTSNAECEK